MADALDTFLADFGARPWIWGEVDCSMVISEWCARCGHAGAAAPFVGCYADQEGCERLVQAHGGLLALVTARADRLGLEHVDHPRRGVIAVIGSRRNVDRQWGAIHDGRQWMVRMQDGFMPVIAPILGMWAVCLNF